MKVAVAYAEAKKQLVLDIELEEGGTALQAVEKSGILSKFDGLDLEKSKLGVWGKIVDGDYVLTDGERVEIYRPALGKPVKKSRPAKTPPAKKPAAAGDAKADAGGDDKAAKIAAMKAKVAAAKAKKAAAAGGEAPAAAGSEADDKAAKIAAIKAKVAAAKAKKAAAAKE